jgi:hypothetical protein
MNKYTFYRYSLYFLVFLITSCNNSTVNKEPVKDKPEPGKTILSKPPATYQDTLIIDLKAAVFYGPDSLQLKKIKEITEETIFEAQSHEYFFQMRNARIVLKKNWPHINIIEAKNVRYLLFKKSDNDSVCVDLDKKDPYGLFLFDTKKDPHFADMMNIDSELPFYFADK